MVRPFAYGREGRRRAEVLSTHPTVEAAFAALDALRRDDTTGAASGHDDCYVVDEHMRPVRRSEPSDDG